MGTLKNFIFSKNNTSPSSALSVLPGKKVSTRINATISSSSLMGADIPEKQKSNQIKEFSNKLSDVIQGPEFLEQLSDAIGSPRASESENSFVERAKETMKRILLDRLNK